MAIADASIVHRIAVQWGIGTIKGDMRNPMTDDGAQK